MENGTAPEHQGEAQAPGDHRTAHAVAAITESGAGPALTGSWSGRETASEKSERVKIETERETGIEKESETEIETGQQTGNGKENGGVPGLQTE